jgi:glutaredoxin
MKYRFTIQRLQNAGALQLYALRVGFCIICFALFFIPLSCSKEISQNANAFFFYEALCPSCEHTRRIEELSGWLTEWASERSDITLERHVLNSDAGEILETVSKEYGIDPQKVAIPVLFIKGKIFSGIEEIQAFLAE